MRLFLPALLLALAARGGGGAFAQPAPSAAPTPRAHRYTLVMPPGFAKVTVGDHTALCLPADEAWVRKALAGVHATTLPTTRATTVPATRPETPAARLLNRLRENRPAVVKQMVTDLALPDDREPNRLFDEQLIPLFERLDALKPPFYFLVCTSERMKALVRDGWGEPRFHYNRVADAVSFDDNISLTTDGPMDDVVIPAVYSPAEAPDARAARLAGQIQKMTDDLTRNAVGNAAISVFELIARHVDERYFRPLNLRRDQEWLAVGATGYFANKYGSKLLAFPPELFIENVTREGREHPVTSRTIDLTRPLDPSVMKPAMVPLYNQAMRRKAVAVVNKWAKGSGEASVTKALTAVRAKTPADGAALVTLIRDVAGVDLSKELAAQ